MKRKMQRAAATKKNAPYTIYSVGASFDSAASAVLGIPPIEGVLEGRLVGADEGVALGAPVGIEDGPSEGAEEGTLDGDVDGAPEGNFDGQPEGDADGISDGTTDGSSESNVDGTLEGDRDGISDGTSEGDLEGVSVADAVDEEAADGGRARPAEQVERLERVPPAASPRARAHPCPQHVPTRAHSSYPLVASPLGAHAPAWLQSLGSSWVGRGGAG